MLQKTSDKNESSFATSNNFGTTSYNFSSPSDNPSSHHIHHSNVWVVVMIQLNPFNGIERYNPVLRANSKDTISPIVMTLACLSHGFPNNMKYAFCLSFMFCTITKIMSEHRAKSTFKLRITPIVRTLR